MKRLLTWRRKNGPPVTLCFLWFDVWVGAFWDRNKRVLYVALFPCLVITWPTQELTRCPHCNRLTPDLGSHCQECYRFMYTEDE